MLRSQAIAIPPVRVQALAWRDDYEEIGHFFTGRITARPPRPTVVFDDETRDAFWPSTVT
jgi:hypothetical protein